MAGHSVAGDKLTVVVSEQTGATHRIFFSDWHATPEGFYEPTRGLPILVGFLEDDSFVLWLYNAQNNDGTAATSNISLYLQPWSKGQLLSDQDLGVTDSGINGRGPLVAEDLHRLWIPGGYGERCYRGVRLEKGQVKADASITVLTSRPRM